tara:strand:+ start:490 stop:825 length:336 start_codon:yes stop_codon:yes gene_type:complete
MNDDRRLGNHFEYADNIESQMRVAATPNKLRKFIIEKLPEKTLATWDRGDEACYHLKCFIKDEATRQWEPAWCWKTQYKRECVEQREMLIYTGKKHGELIKETLNRKEQNE